MKETKTLVVYYSRTGTTKKVAEDIQNHFNCDIEEIIDKKDRSGKIGFDEGAKDAMARNLTDITEQIHNPKNYDNIIIGTPNWCATMAPAVRTYLTDNQKSFKNIAFFTTQGSDKCPTAFKDMKELINQEPYAELMLTSKEVNENTYSKKLDDFLKNS